MDDDQQLAQKLAVILPHLNEKQRRVLLAAEARALGRAGLRASPVPLALRVPRFIPPSTNTT